MIRVLHVIDHLGLGGAQSAVLDLVRNRDLHQVECEVATMHGRGPFAEAIEQIGIPVHSLSTGRWPPHYLWNFAKLVRDGHYDILHFHLSGSNWIAKPLAAVLGQGLRISHDHASGDIRFRGLASLLPDALAHGASHRIIAVSDGVKEFLTRWEGIPADLVKVVPNGIDTGVFQPPTCEDRQKARETLGISGQAFTVGAMGRLAPEKNFSLLVALAGVLPDVQFLIAGEGPERPKLEALIKASNIGNRVRLLGQVTDRAAFYSALDAFVLPSLYEGLPMALLEAMAMGLPCVSSDLPDIFHALRGGDDGLLCSPTDPRSFVNAISQLTHNTGFAKTLGMAARRRCLAMFSAKTSAAAVENIYRLELLFARGQGH
ncbi:MAG: glycosyltransferase [Terrimicrobiaceae bacterium]